MVEVGIWFKDILIYRRSLIISPTTMAANKSMHSSEINAVLVQEALTN